MPPLRSTKIVMTASLRLDDPSLTIEPGRGVYDARRAAALAGIPLRTLNHWAQQGFFLPSVPPHLRVRLWSWSDLVALRAIDWLRRTRGLPDVPTVPFRNIRHALRELEKEGLSRDAIHTALCITEFLVLVRRPPIAAASLWSLCQSAEFQGAFQGLSIGTSTSHQRSNPGDVLQLPPLIPPTPLIAALNGHVSPLLELIHALHLKNANLRATPDLLLPKLISGEVDVSDLDIDVGSLSA
jgi:hypothetical protein